MLAKGKSPVFFHWLIDYWMLRNIYRVRNIEDANRLADAARRNRKICFGLLVILIIVIVIAVAVPVALNSRKWETCRIVGSLEDDVLFGMKRQIQLLYIMNSIYFTTLLEFSWFIFVQIMPCFFIVDCITVNRAHGAILIPHACFLSSWSHSQTYLSSTSPLQIQPPKLPQYGRSI